MLTSTQKSHWIMLTSTQKSCPGSVDADSKRNLNQKHGQLKRMSSIISSVTHACMDRWGFRLFHRSKFLDRQSLLHCAAVCCERNPPIRAIIRAHRLRSSSCSQSCWDSTAKAIPQRRRLGNGWLARIGELHCCRHLQVRRRRGLAHLPLSAPQCWRKTLPWQARQCCHQISAASCCHHCSNGHRLQNSIMFYESLRMHANQAAQRTDDTSASVSCTAPQTKAAQLHCVLHLVEIRTLPLVFVSPGPPCWPAAERIPVARHTQNSRQGLGPA